MYKSKKVNEDVFEGESLAGCPYRKLLGDFRKERLNSGEVSDEIYSRKEVERVRKGVKERVDLIDIINDNPRLLRVMVKENPIFDLYEGYLNCLSNLSDDFQEHDFEDYKNLDKLSKLYLFIAKKMRILAMVYESRYKNSCPVPGLKTSQGDYDLYFELEGGDERLQLFGLLEVNFLNALQNYFASFEILVEKLEDQTEVVNFLKSSGFYKFLVSIAINQSNVSAAFLSNVEDGLDLPRLKFDPACFEIKGGEIVATSQFDWINFIISVREKDLIYKKVGDMCPALYLMQEGEGKTLFDDFCKKTGELLIDFFFDAVE